MNSNEQAMLKKWLTEEELEYIREDEELIKQLKNSVDPKNRTRKQNAYNRISFWKGVPKSRKSRKNREANEDDGLTKEELELVKGAREDIEQLRFSTDPKDINDVKKARGFIAYFTNKTRKRSRNYNKKKANAGNKFLNDLTNAHKAFLDPKYSSVDAHVQRTINTAGKNTSRNIITRQHRNSRNASYNHQKNLYKAQINNDKKNIAKLENRANRYGSLSSPSKPSMSNKFFGLFRTKKPTNSALSNLSKTMKNRIAESGYSLNKTKKNLQGKKNMVNISQKIHNGIDGIKNSYKKWNAANNAQAEMLAEANVRRSKEFLNGRARTQYKFNHAMNNFK